MLEGLRWKDSVEKKCVEGLCWKGCVGRAVSVLEGLS